ncbi:MAG: hypothetical protein KBD88_00605 [Aliarcobacter sp.]|nr:hypothetical protein [Aliarcobacter sp.]
MSMSQEEIEALMSGLDIEDDSSDAEESSTNTKVNTQEIEELLAQTEDYKKEDSKSKNDEDSKISINDSKDIISKKEESRVKTDEIEQLLHDIETNSSTSKDDIEEDEKEDSFEDLDLVSLDKLEDELKSSNSTTEEEPSVIETSKTKTKEEPLKEKEVIVKKEERSDEDVAKDWTSSRIEEGVFPLPAEKDTKVVSQLNQVANDSEEKVSQIFDVLSLTLDNNTELRNSLKSIELFISSQTSLLESLNTKFPNIDVFTEHLNNVKSVSITLDSLKQQANAEDAQIFQAMELMQFNDINRQKIERVMAVIRKLSMYLNNLFEDDGTASNVAVAKHIHGDHSSDLAGDDLDKLIAEFSDNKE